MNKLGLKKKKVLKKTSGSGIFARVEGRKAGMKRWSAIHDTPVSCVPVHLAAGVIISVLFPPWDVNI